MHVVNAHFYKWLPQESAIFAVAGTVYDCSHFSQDKNGHKVKDVKLQTTPAMNQIMLLVYSMYTHKDLKLW